MTTSRLEAFSDGVIAILITIMVLELEAPHGRDLAALRPLLPVLASYLLSLHPTSASTGATTTTCCTPPSASTARCCGPTCTCSSGCR